jgi:hypothetical protein
MRPLRLLEGSSVGLTSLVVHLVLLIVLSLLSFGRKLDVVELIVRPPQHVEAEEFNLADLAVPIDLEEFLISEPIVLQNEASMDDLANHLFQPPAPRAAAGGEPTAEAATRVSGAPSFYGIATPDRKTVFLLDRSTSMFGDRFESARQELLYCIDDLAASQQFSVVFFHESIVVQFDPAPLPELISASQSNKQRIRDWVMQQQAAGSTDPREAFALAFRMQPDAIVILSDGEFDPQIVAEVKRRNQLSEIKIHAIALEVEAVTLRTIARESGGEYRSVTIPPRTAPVFLGPQANPFLQPALPLEGTLP